MTAILWKERIGVIERWIKKNESEKKRGGGGAI